MVHSFAPSFIRTSVQQFRSARRVPGARYRLQAWAGCSDRPRLHLRRGDRCRVHEEATPHVLFGLGKGRERREQGATIKTNRKALLAGRRPETAAAGCGGLVPEGR